MVLLNIRGILSSKDFHETLNHKFVIPFQSSTSTQCGVPSSVYATKSNNKHLFSSFGSNLKKGGDVPFLLLFFSVLNGPKLNRTKTTTTTTMGIPKQKDNDTCFFLFCIVATLQGITVRLLPGVPSSTCITSAADCCSAGDDWLLRMFASFTWEPSSFHKRRRHPEL